PNRNTVTPVVPQGFEPISGHNGADAKKTRKPLGEKDCDGVTVPVPKRPSQRASKDAGDAHGADGADSSPPERPLWQRRPPPELDDQEAERWNNARRHVDPEREEDAGDPLPAQQVRPPLRRR